jgi:hypothetical protein
MEDACENDEEECPQESLPNHSLPDGCHVCSARLCTVSLEQQNVAEIQQGGR